MREILFRGKTPDGFWVEGYLVCHHTFDSVQIVFNSTYAGSREVIPETVGQYTGLTDKNGNKIFEGDIVRTTFDDYDTKNLICSWNEYNLEFALSCYGFDIGLGYMVSYNLEVIGNIHDNPELLKGGDAK